MTPGTRFVAYDILTLLGSGGMGEVYRARDTKLNRDVAIKVLLPAVANDPGRLARFSREAQLLASLNHPNIGAIYGLEDGGDVRALVMELVEGPTLADRIAKGPVPLDEALPIAKQIAEALEAAHEQGIIHRDLKPANIKVRGDGTVKVLDFGLAKAVDPINGSGANATISPTLPLHETQAGVILGTAAYMSPEQARGRVADKRADIWAFGVVLFEMLAGQRPFRGDATDTIVALISAEPDWNALPARVAGARPLLARCLAKDPRLRMRDIGEVRLALDAGLNPPSRSPSANSAFTFAIAGGVAAAIIVIAAWSLLRTPRAAIQAPMRVNMDLGTQGVAGQFSTLAISRDGALLAYPVTNSAGQQTLGIRRFVDSTVPTLPGTNDAHDAFFSPDGRWLGFFANGKMKKIPVDGSAVVDLCDAQDGRGASWGGDGYIIAALSVLGGLARIPEDGGAPVPVTQLAPGEVTHRWPQALPGGDTIVFTASAGASMSTPTVQVWSRKGSTAKTLVRDAYFGRVLPTGDLVYVQNGALWGVRFDAARVTVTGSPVRLLGDLSPEGGLDGGQFDFSSTGVFAYRGGMAARREWPVMWLDKSGTMTPLVPQVADYSSPRFSPDGNSLALVTRDGLVIYDIRRDATARLPSVRSNVWTADGKNLLYSAGDRMLAAHPDGSGEPQTLLKTKVFPWTVSRDGKLIVGMELHPTSLLDLWIIPLDSSDSDHLKAGAPQPYLRSNANEGSPAISPDGKWIAYHSNESGRIQVYVEPVSNPRVKVQISSGVGFVPPPPIWSLNGRELFFHDAEGRILVTEYSVHDEKFVPGKPSVWSPTRIRLLGGSLNMGLHPDGRRFAVFPRDEGPAETGVHMTLLLNFFDEFRRRIEAGR